MEVSDLADEKCHLMQMLYSRVLRAHRGRHDEKCEC